MQFENAKHILRRQEKGIFPTLNIKTFTLNVGKEFVGITVISTIAARMETFFRRDSLFRYNGEYLENDEKLKENNEKYNLPVLVMGKKKGSKLM